MIITEQQATALATEIWDAVVSPDDELDFWTVGDGLATLIASRIGVDLDIASDMLWQSLHRAVAGALIGASLEKEHGSGASA